MQLLNALNWRYAVREFNSEKVPETLLNTLLEATRLSASSYGLQPYRIIQVNSSGMRERLLHHSYGQEKVVNSSHLLIVAAETDIGDHTVDRYIDAMIRIRGIQYDAVRGYADHMKTALAAKSDLERLNWAREQAYIALGTLLTSAAILGIDSCPMTGFDAKAYDRELGLKERGLGSVAIVALGKRSENDSLAEAPKVRRRREEFILSI